MFMTLEMQKKRDQRPGQALASAHYLEGQEHLANILQPI